MTINTPRLTLRPMILADAPDIQRLAGDKDVASTTLNIEHPYEDGMAEKWITSCQNMSDAGELVNFAITLTADGSFLGAIGIHFQETKGHAEIGYWVGKPYWNLGYATEAAKAVVKFGFNQLSQERIHAAHFTRNPASGHVLQHAGMLYEGSQQGPTIKWGVMEQLELYGVSREQFLESELTSV
jgi:RimJ/RimL family protein N-acetyltransferase|tara:strand:+ start:117 stop:668 length:552 start_codon:yes stop_codon:yes gene_type:complete